MKNHWLLKAYLKLPLWGKVAAPAAGIFLVVSAFKALSWAFWLGIAALVVYFIASAVLYFKGNKEN